MSDRLRVRSDSIVHFTTEIDVFRVERGEDPFNESHTLVGGSMLDKDLSAERRLSAETEKLNIIRSLIPMVALSDSRLARVASGRILFLHQLEDAYRGQQVQALCTTSGHQRLHLL